jgi:hypothetical protein
MKEAIDPRQDVVLADKKGRIHDANLVSLG